MRAGRLRPLLALPVAAVIGGALWLWTPDKSRAELESRYLASPGDHARRGRGPAACARYRAEGRARGDPDPRLRLQPAYVGDLGAGAFRRFPRHPVRSAGFRVEWGRSDRRLYRPAEPSGACGPDGRSWGPARQPDRQFDRRQDRLEVRGSAAGPDRQAGAGFSGRVRQFGFQLRGEARDPDAGQHDALCPAQADAAHEPRSRLWRSRPSDRRPVWTATTT